ncbi:MAG: acyloxyacyl hydrolase [Halopseudomonas sp.]|uniref:acyloxyacyl hydrolase n=1 Tax=Halopseudomonas sp. TaxID=2901191 RepID=UPI0030032360
MKYRSLMLVTTLSVMAFSSSAMALDGITLEGGTTNESTEAYRLAAQFEFGSTLWRSDGGAVALDGYWDAGYTYWQDLDTQSLSLTPMFRLQFGPDNGGVTPFLEAGIGAAVFSESNLDDRRDLGSNFQFEDRIGAGLRFASGSELGLRYYHYSNAGIEQPNQGINKAALYYRFNI